MQVKHEQGSPAKVWESIKHYTVRCAICSKWRLIPTKEKYEEIRARIGEQAFLCETARDWRLDISCEVESDIKQDGNLLWAMDKPSIPQTPTGWQRILRVRAEGGTKFADVYYVAPSGKRLRSMVELSRCNIRAIMRSVSSFSYFTHESQMRDNILSYMQEIAFHGCRMPCPRRYINEQPEHIDEGVNVQQFSFQQPVPLDEKYVAKRHARSTTQETSSTPPQEALKAPRDRCTEPRRLDQS